MLAIALSATLTTPLHAMYDEQKYRNHHIAELFEAVNASDINTLEQLLRACIYINAQKNDGATPLFFTKD